MSQSPRWEDHREHLRLLVEAALAAANPEIAVRAALDPASLNCQRIFLIALGKASIGMTTAALDLAGDRVVAGVVAHPRGLDRDPKWPASVRSITASHPYPDEGSLAAGAEAWRMLGDTRAGDLVLVLISGGGSALFEHLRPGITLPDLVEITRRLQHAGVDIRELNTVRRGLSRVKAGGLAARAAPVDVLALALSDVIGDDPASIASGPTVPSRGTARAALEVLEARKLSADFPAVVEALRAAADEGPPALPGRCDTRIIGSNRMALDAAGTRAREIGFRATRMDPPIAGEAREVGKRIGALALDQRKAADPPACLLFGGETTVTVRGAGRGGRNLELALGAAAALDGFDRTALLSFATDGVDGSSDAAGALVTGATIQRARELGLSYEEALRSNDTAAFFDKLGDAWKTGPTGTNVNDLVFALLYP